VRQAPFLDEPDPRRHEQHHRQANAADIGLHAENDPQQIADEDADQRAERQKSNAKDGHVEALLKQFGRALAPREKRCMANPP